jgi:hypothetical protein
MRATRQLARPAAMALGVLVALAVLAFVSDDVDPEAFSLAPDPPTIWTRLLAAGVAPAPVAPPRLPAVVDADSRAPPRA